MDLYIPFHSVAQPMCMKQHIGVFFDNFLCNSLINRMTFAVTQMFRRDTKRRQSVVLCIQVVCLRLYQVSSRASTRPLLAFQGLHDTMAGYFAPCVSYLIEEVIFYVINVP